MSLPDIVQSALGDESVAARISLGGDDELFVTPTRTIVYRAEGLLSDESVEEFPHDAERITVSEGRRKSKVTLDYGLDGERLFALPTKRLDEALHPVLAGVLNATGVTEAGETVSQTFRFSELTLVVTSHRLVKHVGTAVWDHEFEQYHYDDVTDLEFEEGNVATSIVLTANGRPERFKAPNDRARAVREALTGALLEYYGVESLEAFREQVAPAEAEAADAAETADADRGTVSFGDGPTPLSATPSQSEAESADSGDADGARGGEVRRHSVDETIDRVAAESDASDAAFEGSGFESADADAEVAAELQSLREAVEAQNEQLERQNDLLDRLIQELRQGR